MLREVLFFYPEWRIAYNTLKKVVGEALDESYSILTEKMTSLIHLRTRRSDLYHFSLGLLCKIVFVEDLYRDTDEKIEDFHPF